MRTHYYAFGSICRGELDEGSDIDLLACVTGEKPPIDASKFSIYTHDRLVDLWQEGNPFAWHLYLESRLLYSSDGEDFIAVSLGTPSPYRQASSDCNKFKRLFLESVAALSEGPNSTIFHLSCIFLATRNFATCYSLAAGKPMFSRRSPLLVDQTLQINRDTFNILSRARILSTRGHGRTLSHQEIKEAITSLPAIEAWMNRLLPAGAERDRVQ